MKTSGLDVHKDSIFCAIYNGKENSEVNEYSTTTPNIRLMGEYLQREGVKRVAMESTSTYWVPIWDILLEMGFEQTLVNPFLIKQMPGRKSDVKDAQWIATLLHKGLLGSSVVPSPKIQELRTYTRKYTKLQEQKTRSLQKMDRLMVMSGIRIGSCMSSLGTKSVMNIITALIAGESDPVQLEKLVYGNTANKRSGKLREALSGNMKEHHRVQLEWEKEEYDLFEKQTQLCMRRMYEICNEHFSQEMEYLQTIPGVSHISSMIIIAETGADMRIFETSGKITGWAGLRPRNDESAGKYKSTATTKGNKYLRSVLVQVAWAASRMKNSYYMEKFNRLAMRKSRKKALIALARKLLTVAWHILRDKRPYNPQLVHVYDPVKVTAKIAYHKREIERTEKLLS
ncbi:IS110 family transposase [Bacteroidia bacterium]|nr:IS110 family transposase [Bacteroidia bacterium]GHV23886.1 IS110 family transposase [Bacteroidia bacterium]